MARLLQTVTFKGLIKVPPCRIQTSDVQVSIGTDIPLSMFTGKRATSNSVAFQVEMTCPAGIKALSYLLSPSGAMSFVKR